MYSQGFVMLALTSQDVGSLALAGGAAVLGIVVMLLMMRANFQMGKRTGGDNGHH